MKAWTKGCCGPYIWQLGGQLEGRDWTTPGGTPDTSTIKSWTKGHCGPYMAAGRAAGGKWLDDAQGDTRHLHNKGLSEGQLWTIWQFWTTPGRTPDIGPLHNEGQDAGLLWNIWQLGQQLEGRGWTTLGRTPDTSSLKGAAVDHMMAERAAGGKGLDDTQGHTRHRTLAQ